MLRGMLILAMVVGMMSAACSGSPAAEPITVRVNTPTSTAAGAIRSSTPAAPGSTTPEPAELLLSTERVALGGALLVSVTGDVQSGTVTFLGRSHELVAGARSMFTFVGVGVLDEPGTSDLMVALKTANGSLGSLQATVEVLPTQWTVDSVTFEPGQAEALLDPDVVAAERDLLDSIYAPKTPAKYWDGPWWVPVEGPVTGVFGEQRSINGGPPSGHHGGTDISAVPDTPVRAANSGRVVLARALSVRGNMVIIDHGGGVYSGYGHMNSFAVTEGQEVAAGDVIGAVGNTGLSTGAHLHWEISIDGILVDAWRFLDGSNGF